MVLDGTTPGSGSGNYSQMQVAGAIALSGMHLSGTLGSGFHTDTGFDLPIIDNTGQPDHGHVQRAGRRLDRPDIGNAIPDLLCRRYKPHLGRTHRGRSESTAVTFTPGFAGLRPDRRAHGDGDRSHGLNDAERKVQFFNGTTSLGTVPLGTNGSGTLDVSTLPVTTSTISAQYMGDSSFAPSTSTGVPIAVAQATTTTTLTPSTTAPVFGQSVTLTATVQAVTQA